MRLRLTILLSLPLLATHAAEWQPLFNGKDLAGWETFLGRANPGETNYGLNLDPEQVFTAKKLEGGPVIHISGKYWGGLITTQQFGNYHLQLEYKWGRRTWAPRLDAPRDSGICYHCVGPYGADPIYPWPRSIEFNISEQDVGEFWSVDNTIVDAEVVPVGESPTEQSAFKSWCERNGAQGPKVKFRKGGKKQTFRGGGFMPADNYENPVGQWNLLDLYAVGDRSVHVVNGRVALVLTGLRQLVDGKEVPLTKGRIELQTESAEIFFRNIKLRPIAEIPTELLR